MPTRQNPQILIVEARFYTALADALCDGAVAALDAAGAQHTRISVPGALEIAPAIALAAATRRFDGYVALGCVIRGETLHYEIVSQESARGLTLLGVQQGLAIGNGILTVENEKQAKERAARNKGDKGGAAAKAALALIGLRRHFSGREV